MRRPRTGPRALNESAIATPTSSAVQLSRSFNAFPVSARTVGRDLGEQEHVVLIACGVHCRETSGAARAEGRADNGGTRRSTSRGDLMFRFAYFCRNIYCAKIALHRVQKVVVTGAAGFIGSVVADELERRGSSVVRSDV